MAIRRSSFAYSAVALLALATEPAFAVRLSSLTLSQGQLTPSFQGAQLNYTATVDATVAQIRVTARAAGIGTSLTVNGVTTPYGTPVSLVEGPNTVSVVARGRASWWSSITTHTYTVVVTRLVATPPPPAPDPGSGTGRPNILFIVADDLGAEASILYPQLAGNSGQVPTPNLQALAARGLVFDNVWANPVCSPTRAAIVSGLYGHRTGVTNGNDHFDLRVHRGIEPRELCNGRVRQVALGPEHAARQRHGRSGIPRHH
jgi:hypothetical protein